MRRRPARFPRHPGSCRAGRAGRDRGPQRGMPLARAGPRRSCCCANCGKATCARFRMDRSRRGGPYPPNACRGRRGCKPAQPAAAEARNRVRSRSVFVGVEHKRLGIDRLVTLHKSSRRLGRAHIAALADVLPCTFSIARSQGWPRSRRRRRSRCDRNRSGFISMKDTLALGKSDLPFAVAVDRQLVAGRIELRLRGPMACSERGRSGCS